ncbi:hypothetical protein TSMEX_005320 [Taenia solium]|eukprot:TsM_000884500 transcript=TsM_000884500 gene=TsM_000884500
MALPMQLQALAFIRGLKTGAQEHGCMSFEASRKSPCDGERMVDCCLQPTEVTNPINNKDLKVNFVVDRVVCVSTVMRRTVYGPQPLLLRPPLPAKKAKGVEVDDSSVFRCHQRPLKSSDFESIDRHLAAAPPFYAVTLIREYFGFFIIAGSVILLLLNFRTLLDLCTIRNLTRRLRALRRRICGRRVQIQRRSGLEGGSRDDADNIGAFEIPPSPRAVVVETVHTSLTYRLVGQCLWQQKR